MSPVSQGRERILCDPRSQVSEEKESKWQQSQPADALMHFLAEYSAQGSGAQEANKSGSKPQLQAPSSGT